MVAGCMRKLAILLIAAAAAAQELPPGVLLLSRIKRHIREEMQHLPDYTCLETVQRAHKKPVLKAALERLDTVRVEVLFTGERELYSSPGEAAFSDRSITEYTESGMIGDGIFATDAVNIFVSDGATFTYRGEERLHGAPAAKYDFRIPALISRYTVTAFGGKGTVGMRGTFWANPKTYALLRIETHADEIPPILGTRDLVSVVDYAPMRIGEGDVTLAQTAQLVLTGISGEEERAQFDFTHCRAFHAESSITFGAPPAAESGDIVLRPTAAVATARRTLPAGMTIPATLATPIDDGTPVGELIEAKVAGQVEQKGKPTIPDATVLRGRVRRLEHATDAGDYFAVALEFTEIDMPEGPMRFFADLRVGPALSPPAFAPTTGELWIRDVPGVGSFFVRGSRFKLPVGFRMVWRTRDLEDVEDGSGGRGKR
jgi:hypothetical protein